MLFDTGANVGTLRYNLQKMDIDLQEIEAVVLSHAHGDHTGGIEIVGQMKNVQVFVPTSFFAPIKRRLSIFSNVEMVEVSGATEITEGITSTGEIGRIGEQSLMVKTPKGLVIVTGCSHPGLDTIMNFAKDFGTIYGVVGGFHGFDKLETLRDVGVIVPCHCTRLKKRILSEFSKTSLQCAAGFVINI